MAVVGLHCGVRGVRHSSHDAACVSAWRCTMLTRDGVRAKHTVYIAVRTNSNNTTFSSPVFIGRKKAGPDTRYDILYVCVHIARDYTTESVV